MCNVIGMTAYAAKNAEAGLDKQRCLHQTAVKEMGQVVEMTGIIAFEFKTGAKRSQQLQQPLDILLSVLEHEIA